MKIKSIGSIIGGALLFAISIQSSYAYDTEKYGKESNSTIYKITCSSGKNFLVRNENNGKWCSGSTCYNSLDALMRNAFSSCK